jgi:hypothetical protein
VALVASSEALVGLEKVMKDDADHLKRAQKQVRIRWMWVQNEDHWALQQVDIVIFKRMISWM